MRRVAASRVYFYNKEVNNDRKEFHTNHVVELFDHVIVNHYPLKGEIAMTEWLGGSIIISERHAFHTPKTLSIDEVSEISIDKLEML